MVKNPSANAGDTRDVGSITGSGCSPGDMIVFVKTGLDPIICIIEEYLFPFFSTKIFILNKLK